MESNVLQKKKCFEVEFEGVSREGFFQRGRGRSFHVDGPKAEKARELTVDILVREIWRMRASEVKQRVRGPEGV